MPKDPRVDAYIKNAAPFARPILTHLRKVVHDACPEIQETLKWGMPSFTLDGIVCGMAAFKAHATFGFWNEKAVSKALGTTVGGKSSDAMGQFGRITKVSDLPSVTTLKRMVKTAAELDKKGALKMTRAKKAPRAALPVPPDLAAALKLKKNANARAHFESFSPSHRREYVEWIVEAKREETRAKRVAQTIEWLAEGKHRNWKYENC